MKRDDLIAELSRDLRPVKTPLRTAAAAALWLAAGWAVTVAITAATGPMRPGFATQWIEAPRFALETLLGFATGVAAVVAALELSVPGRTKPARTDLPAFVLLFAWSAVLVYGLYDPAIEPSRLGKRPHCFLEGLAFSAPPLLVGFALMRRRVVLSTRRTGFVAGLAAGSLPALMMSAACMYDPWHILLLHNGVIPIVAAAGAVIAGLAWKKV